MDEKTQTIDEAGAGLVESLSYLHEVWTRLDFQAAVRQQARGKLTVREKIVCLFDARTLTEEHAPRSDLDARYGARYVIDGGFDNCGHL